MGQSETCAAILFVVPYSRPEMSTVSGELTAFRNLHVWIGTVLAICGCIPLVISMGLRREQQHGLVFRPAGLARSKGGSTKAFRTEK